MPQAAQQRDWLKIALIALAITYALLAGWKTVSEFDLGWQMATGRYIVQQHHFPSTTLFSYTAAQKEWIYPPFSGVIFYLLFLASGFAALSWLNAVACAGTVALMVARGGRLTATLAIIAVPAVANRTLPRADLFTTVLFAAMLALLWQYYEGKRVHLWMLPVFMLLWVNLHHGFVAGFALIGAYVFFEICEMIFVERRMAALERLIRAAPWILLSPVVTLINPWGFHLFTALQRQNNVTQLLTAFIGEWSRVLINSNSLRQALDGRDPASADWWLLAIGAATILVCIWKKRFGPAVVVAALLYESIAHIRFQAVFAITVVVIGGAMLPALAEIGSRRRSSWQDGENENERPVRNLSPAIVACILAAVFLFTGLRVYDLVSDRYYVESGQLSLFGAGASWWFPERAAEFLEREHLPGNIFHDYNEGGYLVWRVGADYPDFADGRFIPFAPDELAEQRRLLSLSPDSSDWVTASKRWNIQTLVYSVSRYAGLENFSLDHYCESPSWKLVYLDDVTVIFVRNTVENAELLSRMGKSCKDAQLVAPAAASGNSWRARAERFEYLMNSASIYFVLSRDADATKALEEAAKLFADNPNLHLVRAQLLAATNQPAGAEHEYLAALQIQPSDEGWFALARLYAAQLRYAEAARCVENAAVMSQVPYERYRSLGRLYLAMDQPQQALEAFGVAESKNPFGENAATFTKDFRMGLAADRARAYKALNDLRQAIEQQNLAVSISPERADQWRVLADLYVAAGDMARSADAQQHAEALEKALVGAQRK